jgi:hypothetical protein
MRRAVGLVLLLTAVGCERPRVVGLAPGSLDVPEALNFEPTALGYSRVATVSLTNRTRVPVTVTVAATPPFSAPHEVTVPGGAELGLEVTFSPLEAGLAEGTLEVGPARVALRGEGLVVPACETAGPCEVVRFDPDAARCVRETKRDGEACTDLVACLEAGVCRAGACVGQAARCDDANPCTTDSCRVGFGCQHAAVECTPPTNPCHAARCDAVLGCTTGPVVDGTPCGAVSCDEANICLAGACRAVTPPDGFRCAPETMCQAEGVCRQRACVRPAPHALSATWTYTATAAWLMFEGVNDPAGNWYWLECAPSGCSAVSYTSQGFERFRTAVSRPSSARFGSGQLHADDRFIVAAGGLTALDARTGAVAWRALTSEWILELAEDGAGQGFALTRLVTSPGQPSHSLVRFSLATGAELGRVAIGDDPRGLVLDDGGRVYVAWSAPIPATSRFASFDSTLGVRNSHAIGDERPLYVIGDRVVMSDDSERSTLDGALVVPRGMPLRALGGLATPDVRFRATWDGQARPPRLHVERQSGANAPMQVLEVDSSGTFSGFLTRDGSALLLTSWENTSVHLVPATGTSAERCELLDFWGTNLAGFNGSWLVVSPSDVDIFDDRLFGQRLMFFETGDLGIAPHGWTSVNGTPGGARRPR